MTGRRVPAVERVTWTARGRKDSEMGRTQVSEPDRPPMDGAFVAQDGWGRLVWVLDAPDVVQGVAPRGRRFLSAELGRQVLLVRPVRGTAPAVVWRGQELPPEVQVIRMRVAMLLRMAPSAVTVHDYVWDELPPGAWSLVVESGPLDWAWLFATAYEERPIGRWLVCQLAGDRLGVFPPDESVVQL